METKYRRSVMDVAILQDHLGERQQVLPIVRLCSLVTEKCKRMYMKCLCVGGGVKKKTIYLPIILLLE